MAGGPEHINLECQIQERKRRAPGFHYNGEWSQTKMYQIAQQQCGSWAVMGKCLVDLKEKLFST